jgi:acetate kinase
MFILVVNCGSSSLKFELIDVESFEVPAGGIIERIGQEGALIKMRKDHEKISSPIHAANHREAVAEVLQYLTTNGGVLKSPDEVEGIGHRVVHGGEKFQRATLITDEVLKGIHDCIGLAPLHNPANLMGIDACRALFPSTPQVAVFDTAFHHTIPPDAFVYAIPYDFYLKYGIRRYGFHGTSHKFVSRRLAQLKGKNLEDLRIISCHLGNGCSITAIKKGHSVDTSMGMTPLEGLVMGTRSGDLDPAIIPFLVEKENVSFAEIDFLLNRRSGLLGISGRSNDMRDLMERAANGDRLSILALDVFCYRLKKYIGGYAAAMGGVDDIIFTAGIGENCSLVRKKTLEDLEFLGIALDEKLNESASGETLISTPSSRVGLWVIPTNEELMIATETKMVLEERPR